MLKGYSERERREVHDKICKLAREFNDKLALYREHFPDGVCLEDVNAEPHGKDGQMTGPNAVRLASYEPNAEELKFITARENDLNALLKQVIVDLIYNEIKP